jgi:alkane 1-monooxygenase
MFGTLRAGGWAYFSALLLPSWCLLFLLTSPHPALEALLWLLPMGVPVAADYFGLKAPQTDAQAPGLDWLPVCLAGLFVATVWLLLMESQNWRLDSPKALADTLANLVVVKFLFGSNAAVCSLITAHELIHRKIPPLRVLGRVLLVLCCYEHFFTEHLRGHHRRAGSLEDPASARLGESYREFWRRTVPAQFQSAWRLECQRLRLGRRFELRWLRHRVLQGVVAEFGLLVAIGLGFGLLPLLAFVVQALMAVRNLEAINYVQHWGLTPTPWHTDAWCSTYLLLGLAHHAHHHCCPKMPYYRLKEFKDAPKLPCGYFALMFMVAYCNRSFQEAALAELRRLDPETNAKAWLRS